ncbi:helix-turn-helix transcriptional regulator [Thauera sp. 63]|uniref:helix-turn-helix transcriptional regulator n=1 Tax=Thauera sp. 63 TaxID=497321 RepID=UPI0002CE0365|nr:helix-turn-helix transcriptional regulator [Thauera sp. 63]ENO77622.1 hypothetical protein C664_10597 [Thauera sp. 63]
MPDLKNLSLRFTGSESVRARRKELGLNQNAFWRRVAVTQSAGSRYESERDIPEPIQLLLQLAYGSDEDARELLAALRASSPE